MEPYIGEIRMFAGTFAPQGWLLCDGSVLQIGRYNELFSLITTIYGGDGQSNFAVPDLRSRAPISWGQGKDAQGNNLSPYTIGQKAGVESIALVTKQLPAHNHTLNGVSGAANQVQPDGKLVSAIFDPVAGSGTATYSDATANAVLNQTSIGNTGEGAPFTVIQPVLPVTFIIAWQGIYPSRP